MKQYIEKPVEMYNEIIEQFEEGPNWVGWGSERSQTIRFRQFMRIFDFNDIESILDVGCGLGDFYEFLSKNDITKAQYTGIDINTKYIDYCRNRYKHDKNCEFIKMDILEDSGSFDKFDLVVASGVFGTPFDGRDEFVKKMLHKFYELSRYGFVFNMENSLGIKKISDEINYDPIYWLSYVIKSIDCQVQFYTDYHDNDFTIAVRKK